MLRYLVIDRALLTAEQVTAIAAIAAAPQASIDADSAILFPDGHYILPNPDELGYADDLLTVGGHPVARLAPLQEGA